MSNPEYLVLFGIVFFLFGTYNVFAGSRRIRRAQEQGIILPWYKQTMLLVGIEYILIALVCLLRLSVVNNWLPQSLHVLVIPAYIVIFIPSAIFAGLIVRQSIANLRQSRQSTASTAVGASSTSANKKGNVEDEDDQQRNTSNRQHRRERRQKAAAARRRRAGKA